MAIGNAQAAQAPFIWLVSKKKTRSVFSIPIWKYFLSPTPQEPEIWHLSHRMHWTRFLPGTCSVSSIWCCKPLTSSASCCVVCRIDAPLMTALLCNYARQPLKRKGNNMQLICSQQKNPQGCVFFTWSTCLDELSIDCSLTCSQGLRSTASHTCHKTATRPTRRCHSDRHGPAAPSGRKLCNQRVSWMNRNSCVYY